MVASDRPEHHDKHTLAVDISHDVDTVIGSLTELINDELDTLRLLSSELDVAQLRKEKAEALIRNLDVILVDRFAQLSDEHVLPVFSGVKEIVDKNLCIAPAKNALTLEDDKGWEDF